MFYNGLTVLDEHLTPQLALAESIDSDKATVLDDQAAQGRPFPRRQGADLGRRRLLAAPHKDPKVGSIAKTLAAQIQEEGDRPQQVQITLSAPNADLPWCSDS